jgi:photosystem II stability/assembly factor-like uncharacterized protein
MIMRKIVKSIMQLLLVLFSMLLIEGCSGNRAAGDIKGVSENNTWKVIGPGGGGGVLKPTISPFDENFVMTHCDMTGAYVSLDGGSNWKMKNLGNVPDDFEFDPVDPDRVYIATRGFLHSEDRGSGISMLLRSDDKGGKWRIIYPDVSRSKRVERLQSTSLKPSDLIDGALDGTIQKVCVDNGDNKKIYFGLSPLVDYMSGGGKSEVKESARLVLSTDEGVTWRVVASLPGQKVLGIFPDKKSGQLTVFTENSCCTVNEITGDVKVLPLPVKSLIAVEGGSDESGTMLYIQTPFSESKRPADGGMYVTDDMGLTWKQVNNGILDGVADGKVPRFRQGLAVCESKPDVAYISTINPVINKDGQPEAIYSIYKTIDAGINWKPVLLSSTPQGYITSNFKGSWMEESFDPGWGGSPIDLAVAPGNPDICFAGDNGRGYKTTDGGKSWEQAYSNNNADGSYSNSGLNVTTCYGVHFDPFARNHFFICYTDMGLFHTYNGGESWYHSITDVPRSWQNTCYDIKFDPDVKGKVWSVWANAHDLPRTKMFGRWGFDNYEGGVAVSEDGGKKWRKSNKGLPENSVCTNILIDASTHGETQTLYVSVFDKGVYKSSDGGENWVIANNGLGTNLFAWELRQNTNGRLFVLFARGLSGESVSDGAIYYSDDKAVTWNRLSLPEGVNGPHDLLIDPENADIMYVSCWPSRLDGKDTHGGVIKTVDGGLTWKLVFDDRVRVNAAGMDPLEPEKIYINTFQNAAYRSTDYGNTWNRIEGYRFKWGQRAVPDINNPGMLFLTTYGGSVFYGPAAGVPDASDDVLNMPEGWW